MSSKTEEDWIEDCHDNPMYAADYILTLEAENEALRANIDWITKESRHYQNKYQIEESANIELDATIAELNQAAEEDYNRSEDALVQLEATIASFAAVDAVRREENTELEAQNKRLKGALDACAKAPFETVDGIRKYARTVLLEENNG